MSGCGEVKVAVDVFILGPGSAFAAAVWMAKIYWEIFREVILQV